MSQAKYPSRKVSWEAFERRYGSREDRFKYEWVDGIVVKTIRTFIQSNLYIFVNLKKCLEAHQGVSRRYGDLYGEVESWFGNSYRSPNISFFSNEQSQLFGEVNQLPLLVIEVISDNCNMNTFNEKLVDYRNAKVAIVWFVCPKAKEVHVYRGKQMTICTGDDICSAEPVIPGFLIKADEVFK
ncbi:MAG: Uma2 family endonuclease [Saprospiraceae bacterium]|nr:Uma2 family endonuclease [Saprospiraceae bacterium]